jgi:hypothetical protein
MAIIEKYEDFERATCILCGEDLLKLENPIETKCDYCGKVGTASHQCVNGHYICDTCLSIPVNSFIKKVCLDYTGVDVIDLAVKIMNTPIIRMHGAEHHFLTPAVLTTIVNNRTNKFDNLEETLNKLDEKIQREAPRQCSLIAGTCGGAIGSSIFLKMYLEGKESPEKINELSDFVKNESIRQIDEIGLSRCCKRDTYISLRVTSKFLNDNYNLNLIISEPKCTFSLRNKSCGREDCPFYNIGFSLV